MTPKERQALREKHRNKNGNCAECCFEWIDEWQTDHFSTKYPCDVIKVLDATENLKSSDLKTEVEPVSETAPKCDHLDTRLRDDHRPFAEFDDFAYCPKCGEKL